MILLFLVKISIFALKYFNIETMLSLSLYHCMCVYMREREIGSNPHSRVGYCPKWENTPGSIMYNLIKSLQYSVLLISGQQQRFSVFFVFLFFFFNLIYIAQVKLWISKMYELARIILVTLPIFFISRCKTLKLFALLNGSWNLIPMNSSVSIPNIARVSQIQDLSHPFTRCDWITSMERLCS